MGEEEGTPCTVVRVDIYTQFGDTKGGCGVGSITNVVDSEVLLVQHD